MDNSKKATRLAKRLRDAGFVARKEDIFVRLENDVLVWEQGGKLIFEWHPKDYTYENAWGEGHKGDYHSFRLDWDGTDDKFWTLVNKGLKKVMG